MSDYDMLNLNGEDFDISWSVSDSDVENIPDNTHSHVCSRTEFGWQLVSETDIQTHRVVLGKEKEETSDEFSATQMLKGSISASEDTLMKQLQEEEERVASSDGYLSQESAWGILAWRKRIIAEEDKVAWENILMKRLQDEEELVASSDGYLSQESAWGISAGKKRSIEEEDKVAWEMQLQELEELVASSAGYLSQESAWRIIAEDKVNNAVASSSSSSYTYLHEFDFNPLSSTEGESSTIHRHSRHSQLSPAYHDTLQSSNRGFATLELPTSEFSAESHKCGVCIDIELYDIAQIIRLPMCTHTFCRECLRTYTMTRINEGRYPIVCPVCAIERTRVNNSHITQAIVDKLRLSKKDLEKLSVLQLVAHSVILRCPKCKQTMNVDRKDYGSQQIIICPLPACHHLWCKECLRPVASFQTVHDCKQDEFEELMRKEGWKYCPGCKTPVQKNAGCNHMICESPGCNVHFCYKCGISIIDTSDGGDVGDAVTRHYNNCVM